jgi:alcohol dehydrogenase class IV
LSGTAAVIMTDPTLHRLGLTDPIEGSLQGADVRTEVFTEVATEPMLASVGAAVDMCRERACDLIVAVGGGSSMDSAKAVSLLVGNGGKFQDYTERRVGTEWQPGRPTTRKGPPVMTVPTTAGTGCGRQCGYAISSKAPIEVCVHPCVNTAFLETATSSVPAGANLARTRCVLGEATSTRSVFSRRAASG